MERHTPPRTMLLVRYYEGHWSGRSQKKRRPAGALFSNTAHRKFAVSFIGTVTAINNLLMKHND